MPPRRRTAAPPPIDVPAVRRKLDEGKIVRVGISRSAQFPDGATGRVRRVGDPAVDGEEYVQVELSLNGTKDVLPFTPADLTPATRGRPPGSGSASASGRSSAITARSPADAPPGQGTASSAGRINPGASPLVDDRVGAPRRGPVGPASPPPSPFTPSPSSPPEVHPPIATIGVAPVAEQQVTKVRTPTKASRAGRKPAAVAITIATTDNDPNHWRIEAKVGSRVVLRAGAIPPARVWELVRVLDDETLVRAVGVILNEQREDAQARVDALAAELARVRAELEALPGGTT